MTETNVAPGARLLSRWRQMSHFAGGRRMFTREVGRMAAYSDTIRARVLELEPGYCRVEIEDRPQIRNHLGSIHAVALTNLGEMASGLAMLVGLDEGVRGIAVRLDSAYRKKARGRLEASCRCDLPEVQGPIEHQIVAEIRNAEADIVATVTASWRLDRV